MLKGNKNMWTLLPLKFRRHIFAGNGESGGAGRSFGKDGEDVTVEVPCGTVVFDAETGEYLCEVRYDGETVICLPHRVVIELSAGEESGLDAIAG